MTLLLRCKEQRQILHDLRFTKAGKAGGYVDLFLRRTE